MIALALAFALLLAAFALLWVRRRCRRRRIADLVRLDVRIAALGPPLRRRPHACIRI